MMLERLRHPALVLLITLVAGCSTGNETASQPEDGPVVDTRNVSLNKNDYPVFPDADAGADPAVSAEHGGKGFTGERWQTKTDFELIGDPRAIKGGLFREYSAAFPGTLRVGGPEWNSSTNYSIASMVYETLLKVDPTSLEYIPVLATHWQIAPDKMTFRFRINPNARFSDNQPVTADDVAASWLFYTDKGLQDPTLLSVFDNFEKPVAESKYIVRVKAKTPDWKDFLNFATFMHIFPAHVLKNVNGATYLKEYNFKYLPGSGPYIINESDIKKGTSISIRRRPDFWAEKARLNVGLNNFDEVRIITVRDENLAFEMLKKGDFDFYAVSRARQWVEETNFDRIQNGLIHKRKVFNNKPSGIQGFAFNTRRPPFDDLRVRKALTLLLNRELLIEKLFFKEYLPQNSYFVGTVYENPNNPKNNYDPQTAVKLLAEAGWKDRNAQGQLIKNGTPFAMELLYVGKTFEPILTVYQDDLRKVGINVNLREVTAETHFQLINDRKFDLALMGWGTTVFPDPEQEWHSRLADVNDTNNITGFKDPKMDQIMEKYGQSFDLKERIELIKELDGIMTNQYHYILQWYGPSQRMIYWNKFGHPPGYLSRIGEITSDIYFGPGVEQLWWIDRQQSQKLQQAMADPSIKLDAGETENRYWQEYAKKTQQAEVRQ
jgi:microcin C transport system substrate-binding protein